MSEFNLNLTPKSAPKKKQLSAVIAESDYLLIRRLADKFGVPMGEVVRQVIEVARPDLEKSLRN